MGQLIQGHFGSSAVPSLTHKPKVIRVNFQNKRVTSINRQRPPISVRTPLGRKATLAGNSAMRGARGFSRHIGVHDVVAGVGGAIEYHHLRKEAHLTRFQAAKTAAVGTGIAIGVHHAARAYGARGIAAVGAGVGGHVLGGMAQDRMVKHYKAQNRAGHNARRR